MYSLQHTFAVKMTIWGCNGFDWMQTEGHKHTAVPYCVKNGKTLKLNANNNNYAYAA